MHTEEFNELKHDILELRDQLTQLMDIFEAVMPEIEEENKQNLKRKKLLESKNSVNDTNISSNNNDYTNKNDNIKNNIKIEKNIPSLQKNTSSESLISDFETELDRNLINDTEIGNNNESDYSNKNEGGYSKNIEKYVIKRRNKLKKKRNYDPRFKNLEARHTIITSDVLTDLQLKGYSDVKRHANEEDIKPINDPLHVNILYNFGFVLDREFDKHNAIILLGSCISHNVIHINMVKKLNLKIEMQKTPFVVTSNGCRFESNSYVNLTVAVNLGNFKNRMFQEEFVVSELPHHNDMIVVGKDSWHDYQLFPVEPYEFETTEDVFYIL
ncbi:hypothetical protein H8356DRAFT_1641727 [Neocallimastix lanati (nom. inval.)]|jgi:hypothetical protein|uniref:Uncharacterized protein n=1 Tax=Neocallimastix californiae TaxID=1754190 RepID=A0A1Y2B2K8_9FUNG|nr:hypothetical protein H8356DRAFT_1641727 [Neocallimastix sp. JGI-2020a]ORY29059.1 hypothetical protein LY90DRAFT_512974 [Neocallimastix californiae]|eukprot:ORY29059.1 hypothetical protein LY90DRAFT_512974 [Neocallimastix californiae]